jgi:Galactose-3-O-sulfotransferase
MRPTVIFVHIGKTAGTTLNAIASRHFPPQRVFMYDSAAPGTPSEQLAALSFDRRANLALVLGHVQYGIHEALPGPSTYITLLRDPVERIASHYGHVLRYSEHRLHADVTRSNMTLNEYAGSRISEELDNWQTRCVAGGDAPPIGECTTELLDRAKQNLETQFAWFGLAERFEESVVLLRRRLGWWRDYYVRLNTSNGSHDGVSEAVRAEILRWNALDQELYDYAKARFDRIVAQTPAVELELRLLRTSSAAYRQVLAARRAAAPAARAVSALRVGHDRVSDARP